MILLTQNCHNCRHSCRQILMSNCCRSHNLQKPQLANSAKKRTNSENTCITPTSSIKRSHKNSGSSFWRQENISNAFITRSLPN